MKAIQTGCEKFTLYDLRWSSMPNFIENFGLDFLFEEEEIAMGFMAYLTQEGTAINGYYGCPTLFDSMGAIDLFVKTRKMEDGNLAIADLDTHCCGTNVWEMRNTGISITPKDALPMERVYLFLNKDGEGMVPIHLTNADVLPSFLNGDVVKMQMCALPLQINYFSDEEEYAASIPKDKNGEKWLVGEGALLPIDFLVNHCVEKAGGDSSVETDDRVMFRAEVKELYHGLFQMGEEKEYPFINCIADTQFGELCFAHTIQQIPEEQRDHIRIGATISGVCILSGDVAIFEYEKGFVKDFEHDLRLLRQTIVHGEAERMRPVLRENAVYTSEASGKTYEGKDEIIKRLDVVRNNQIIGGHKCFAYPATIEQAPEETKYSVGTRCIVIAYDDEERYDAIAFLDVDEEGFITEIHISEDGCYRFALD